MATGDANAETLDQIMTTLSDNRRWITELESQDNFSMKAFEWLSLFILVFLLKFATDSTREIYVRLTSPCPSPKHPSSPTYQSPISSPKRPSSPDPTNQSPGVPERTESSLGGLRISSPEPPVLYSQKHDGDRDAAVTPGRRGPIAIYGFARNDRLKRSPSQDKDIFDGIDRCFRAASSCNSMAAIEARIASDEAERIAREALGLSCTFSDDEDDGGQADHFKRPTSFTNFQRSGRRRVSESPPALRRSQSNLRPPPVAVAENSKCLRLAKRTTDVYKDVASRLHGTLPEPLTTCWGGGIGRWQSSEPFHFLSFPGGTSIISDIECTGSATRFGARKVDSLGRVRPVRRRPAGGAGAGAVILTPTRSEQAAELPARNKLMQGEHTSTLLMPAAADFSRLSSTVSGEGERAAKDAIEALKARDWNRMYEMTQNLQKDTRDLTNSQVELREEIDCLKADKEALRKLNVELRDLLAEERSVNRDLHSSISMSMSDRDLSSKYSSANSALKNYVDNYLQTNTETARLRHENEQLLACYRREKYLKETERAEFQAEIDALKSMLPERQVDGTEMTLVLDMAFERAGLEGTRERDRFQTLLAQDLADASGVHARRFCFKNMQAGSVCVDTRIREDASAPSFMVVHDLQEQALNPDSKLRQGRLTCHLKSISVKHSTDPRVSASIDRPSSPRALVGDQEHLMHELEGLKTTKTTLQHEVESLKRSLASSMKGTNEEAEYLRDQVADQQKEIEELKSRHALANAASIALQVQLESLRALNAEAEDHSKKLADERNKLSRDIAAVTEELQRAKQANEDLQLQATADGQELMSVRKDRDALNERFDRYMKETANAQAELESQHESLNEECEMVKDELKTVKRSLLKLEAVNEKLTEDSKRAEDLVRTSGVDLDELKRELQSLRVELQSSREENAKLTLNMRGVQVEKDFIAEQHETTKSTLKGQINALEQENESLQKSIEDQVVKMEREKTELKALEDKIVGLKESNAELDAKFKEQSSEKERLRGHVQEQVRKLEVTKGLEVELKTAQSLLREMSSNHEAQRERLLSEIAFLQRELGRKSEELAHVHDRYASKDAEMHELKDNLRALSTEREQIFSDLTQERSQHLETQARNEMLLKSELDTHTAERQRADQEQARAEHLQEELERERTHHAETKKHLGEVSSQREMAAERVRRLEADAHTKEEEMLELQAVREAKLKELNDKSMVLESLRKTLTEVATDRQQLKEALDTQMQERQAVDMQLQMAKTMDEHATVATQQMQAMLSKHQQEITDLEKAVERKTHAERDLLRQVQDLQQMVSRHQTSEQELNAKVILLQGAVDREKLHAQVSREQWSGATGAREATLLEESMKRETLARELSEAQEESGRLRSKVELLQEHSHAGAVKISRLEQELAIWRRNGENPARAVYEQQMEESRSSLLDSSRPLPPSPPNDQNLSEIEHELLSDALNPSTCPTSPPPPLGISRSLYATNERTRSSPVRPSSTFSSPYSNVDKNNMHSTLPAVPPLTPRDARTNSSLERGRTPSQPHVTHLPQDSVQLQGHAGRVASAFPAYMRDLSQRHETSGPAVESSASSWMMMGFNVGKANSPQMQVSGAATPSSERSTTRALSPCPGRQENNGINTLGHVA